MKTIFLAEGEKHVREALRLMFQHQPDFSVIGEAGTAEGALAQVCQHPPDIILLDWTLPGLHHQRMLVAMKQCCPQISIFATSVKPEQRKIALSYPVDGFLSKQLSPQAFVAALQKNIFREMKKD